MQHGSPKFALDRHTCLYPNTLFLLSSGLNPLHRKSAPCVDCGLSHDIWDELLDHFAHALPRCRSSKFANLPAKSLRHIYQ